MILARYSGLILINLVKALRQQDLKALSESYIATIFANGRGVCLAIGNTKSEKSVTIMAIVDRSGLPSLISRLVAKHYEVTLVQ